MTTERAGGAGSNAMLALSTPVKPFGLGPIVLIEAGDYAGIVAKKLLRARSLLFHDIGTERSHIVDLLLDPRTRELLVDGETVAVGDVFPRRVPKGGLENDHRARSAFDRHGMGRSICIGRLVWHSVGCWHDDGRAVVRLEVIDGEECVDGCQVA